MNMNVCKSVRVCAYIASACTNKRKTNLSELCFEHASRYLHNKV